MTSKQFYPYTPNEVRLPLGGRYYFDCFSSEAGEITPEEKLLHIGYVLTKGFNLKKYLNEFIKSHTPTVDQDIVKNTLIGLIGQLRFGETYDILHSHLEHIATYQQVEQLFEDELMMRYKLWSDDWELKHEIIPQYWDIDQILQVVGTNKGRFDYIATHPTGTPYPTADDFITDHKTNTFCLSGIFESSLCPEVSKALKEEIYKWASKHNIRHNEITNTSDVWCRDYMPIQIRNNHYVFGTYNPDYVNDPQYLTQWDNNTNPLHISGKPATDICKDFTLLLRNDGKPLIIDGGNIVKCIDKDNQPCIIMTDKTLQDNHITPDELIHIMGIATGARIILLPWEDYGKDPKRDKIINPVGHTDGVVRYVAPGQVLLFNADDYDPRYAHYITQLLLPYFDVTELTFFTHELQEHTPEENTWSYINYLHVGNHILLPSLGHKTYDKMALEQFTRVFAPHGITVEQVKTDMTKIVSPFAYPANSGGALNCLSWNIQM